MKMLIKFADHGVIHGDFNEFNIMLGIILKSIYNGAKYSVFNDAFTKPFIGIVDIFIFNNHS